MWLPPEFVSWNESRVSVGVVLCQETGVKKAVEAAGIFST